MNQQSGLDVLKTVNWQVEGIPYWVRVEEGKGFFCAFIPCLSKDLFHAFGETEDEAIEVLAESFPDLSEWHRKNMGDLPPPEIADEDNENSNEARGTCPGLQCIIRAVAHGASRLQPRSVPN